MKITISKNQWQEMGRKAGWMKTATQEYQGDPCPKCGNNKHSILNPSNPTINECTKCKHQWNPNNEPKEPNAEELVSFSYGTTPEKIITERTMKQTPAGYPMTIRNQEEWKNFITKIVNQGIDSHLEAFTRSKFDYKTGKCLIHPEEMKTLLRRLDEIGDEEFMRLRTDILATLGVE